MVNIFILLFVLLINGTGFANFQRNVAGFQGYSQIFRNGKQVWIQTLDGKIINAGF